MRSTGPCAFGVLFVGVKGTTRMARVFAGRAWSPSLWRGEVRAFGDVPLGLGRGVLAVCAFDEDSRG